MLAPHSLPQLIFNRVHAAVGRLEQAIWTDPKPVTVEAGPARQEICRMDETPSITLKPIRPPVFWGRLFDRRWWKLTFPESTDDQTWLHWQDQSEATLYVNKVPYFGFNIAHTHALLPEGIREVWIQSSCIQSAIWHPKATGLTPEGSRFRGAALERRDEDTWHAYHDLKVLFDLALYLRTRDNPSIQPVLSGAGQQPALDRASPELRLILKALDEAVDALDTEGPASLRKGLRKAYRRLKSDETLSRCTLTGHAHVDLVWMWPERMGERKAINVFATADRLMNEYPEYRFAYSQPASYEAVEREEPDLYQRMLSRIRNGTWQATGAMYVESDTLIACGEALLRSFLIGQEAFSRINGQPSRLTWLPDVFGYSACMPQIMRQTGVDCFFTTKMTWNAVNRFPYSSFIWRGPDGSEVLAHVTQDVGYNSETGIQDLVNPMMANQQGDVHSEFLAPTGYGDGGGGPTMEMMERARRLDGLPGLPNIQWDHPEAFFERLATSRNKLPVHVGECYLEYHRGTYTTHCNLKEVFRGLERSLQTAEAVTVATGETPDLVHTWKRLVFSQFHDYIPGSSVWDVYREGIPELESLRQTTATEALKMLEQGETGASCLFNPHAVPVKTWIEEDKHPRYVELPPLQGVPEHALTALNIPEPVALQDHTLENGLVSFRVNRHGWVDRLEWGGVRVPLSDPLGQLVLYADRAGCFDAWDIDRHVLSLGRVCDEPCQVSTESEGDHRKSLLIERSIGKQSSAAVRYTLEAGSPLLHISIELDWQEPEHLLKFQIPTGYCGATARCGSPFGSVSRPNVSNGRTAEAIWEVPFSRWLAVHDDGEQEGLFVVTKDRYGAGIRDGRVGVSLVRSPKVTGMDAGHDGPWPRPLTRLKDLPDCSDLGTHKIELALGQYSTGLPREQHPASLADTLYTPSISYVGHSLVSGLDHLSGGETLVPCWVKPEGGSSWVLRLHEVAGQRGKVRVVPQKGWRVERIDAAGQPMKGKPKGVFTPYELVSLRFAKSDASAG